MPRPSPVQTVVSAAGRLSTTLADPARRERSIAWTLVAYALLWAFYGAVAKSGQDVHPDMAELVTWAREPALGYFKHPPFAAWVVAGWFAVFPVADWSYYLLAAVMPSLALWFVWKICADYLDDNGRVAGVALLTLTPFFGVLALKFNVNTVLIPLWAATAWCFLRSFERRSVWWALLAGVCAAAAMLTKYWSVFLIAGLVIAALLDNRRLDYLRSPAPWLTVLAGALVLAPHVYWLVTNDYPPFRYVNAAHRPATLFSSAKSVIIYLLGSAGYVALPVIVAFLAARARRAVVSDMLWPLEASRRLAACAFWGPLLLPVFAALAAAIEITSIWSMSSFALLPVVLLSPVSMTLSGLAVNRIVALTIAFPVVMVLASPGIAFFVHRAGLPADQTDGSLVAPWVEAVWREKTKAPLRIVGGDNAFITSFYLADRPSAFPDFNKSEAIWMDEARVTRTGMAMVCRIDNTGCLNEAARRAEAGQTGRPVEVTVTRELLGFEGKTNRYRIWALPPR
jgi:4-amino-4-deoxy-L-arabinose transferase-like glycosyltransferase